MGRVFEWKLSRSSGNTAFSAMPSRLSGAGSRSILRVAVLTALLVAGGCAAVGPDFEKPSAKTASKWIEQESPAIKSESVDYRGWWDSFNDPALNTLIEIARKQNPNLQIAGLKILEARAQLGIAIGNLFPQQQALQAAYNYTESSQNAPNTAGNADLRYQTYNYGFDAAWELDFWGKFRRSVESADANLTATVADYDNAMVTLYGDVASTYILVRTYEERLRVARENAEIQKQSLKLTETRFRLGAVTELDVQQARTLLYDTESQIPQLEIGLRQALHALSILLGMPPGDLSDLLGDKHEIPETPAEVAVGIPAQLLTRRPDVRSAELQAAAQCAQIGVAKADLFPRISIAGNFGFLSGSSNLTRTGRSGFAELFDWKSFAMAAGPTIEWPILNYGRITNNVRAQDAKFQQLLVSYQLTVLNAAKEVEDALVGFLMSRDQVGLLSQSVVAAKRAVDLSLLQYREGAVDYTRVLDTQQLLMQQEDRLTQSRGAVPTNLVALYKALGGGWDARVPKDFVSEETLAVMRKRTNWGNLLPPADLPRNLEPPKPSNVRELPRPPDW